MIVNTHAADHLLSDAKVKITDKKNKNDLGNGSIEWGNGKFFLPVCTFSWTKETIILAEDT